jgi:anthranilate phosphoribosyltransferase
MSNEVAQLLQKDSKTLMRSIIQRIATGPDMSKNIAEDEARAGMAAVLRGEIDPVQTAIFLIALRMKRETDAENKGVLAGIRDCCTKVTAEVDEVLDMSDPYNGYNRSLPVSPFLPAVMAAVGVPAVSHGVETMGPKFGITHHRVLKAAGVPVDLSVEAAAVQLADKNIGWAYVDQQVYCPPLHSLTALRANIVKRQAITTVETLSKPISGKHKTHCMAGYVHAPYTHVYSMLARHAGFDSCLLVRGVEGGIIPSLRQTGKAFYYHDKGAEQGQDFDPASIGIEQELRAIPLPDDLPARPASDDVGAAFDAEVAARLAADQGLSALAGKHGIAYDALVYAGAIALWHLHKYGSLQAAADCIREAIDSGRALQHFNAARTQRKH